MDKSAIDSLGVPDIELSGLRIWVHGRQCEDSHDYWDGNWLWATAHCEANLEADCEADSEANGASAFVTGSLVHLSELNGWYTRLVRLNETLKGEAELKCLEPRHLVPYFNVVLMTASLGHIGMEVSIISKQLNQRHWFQFGLDQTFLGPLVKQVGSLLERYPIRNPRPDGARIWTT